MAAAAWFLLKTLNVRIQAFDDLGLHDAARLDRVRYDELCAQAEPPPPANPEVSERLGGSMTRALDHAGEDAGGCRMP
jgi:hypothetical protein